MYTIVMADLSCTCTDFEFNGHKRTCKHVRSLLVNGVHHRPDNKFSVYKEGKNWFAGKRDVGFVGPSLNEVMNQCYKKIQS